MQSFSELNLSAPLLQAIKDLGYETPSPIQAQTLPLLLGEPTDFIGLAATGTGKTAAFGIPFVEKIDTAVKGVQVLVLCPTRELALQVTGQINLIGKPKGIRAIPIYGGSSYSEQIHGLRQGATVVVGTPGRIIDHMERGTLKLDKLTTLVLDEADEMISMGFKEDIEKIMSASPRENSKIWLFSATMSREIRSIADQYLKSPKQVQVNRTEMLSGTVEQIFYRTHESDKPEILCKLIDMAEGFFGVIFCQTKALVTDLTQYLIDKGYKVDCLHGDKDQNARERTMRAFRERKVNILVCTDVAARGLDVKDVTHVINYSLPRELDNYVHRIGRTARSGKAGIAISLVTPSHRGLVERIERMTKSRMTEGRLPSRKDVASKKVAAILANFQGQESYKQAVEIMDESWKETIANLTTEEVAGRFLTLMFPDIFAGIVRTTEKPKLAPSPVQTEQKPERSPYSEARRERSYSDDRRERPRRSTERSYDRGSDRSSNRASARDTERNFDRSAESTSERPSFRRESSERREYSEQKPSYAKSKPSFVKDKPGFSKDKPSWAIDKAAQPSDRATRFRDSQSNERRKNISGGNRPPRRSPAKATN